MKSKAHKRRSIALHVRVTEQELRWIDHFAAKAGRLRAGWLHFVIRQRLLEEAQNARTDDTRPRAAASNPAD